MTTELSSAAGLRLVLVATVPQTALAADVLARHLGLGMADALRRLAEAPSVLAERLGREQAQLVADLLRSLGLRVRIEGGAVHSGRADLSIQMAVPILNARAVKLIAAETGMEAAAVVAALQVPGGLVLTGLAQAEADRMQRVLGRMTSLNLTVSDPASAVYDVFLPAGPLDDALTARLRMMGAEADPITGAVAAGLDRALCAHLVARFPQSGLLALNRAFQRFDLYLMRVTGWVTRDLADFLIARTGLPRSRFEVLSEGQPLRIELGLTHAAARQFRADYASIGLHTRMLLSGLPEDSDNPKF